MSIFLLGLLICITPTSSLSSHEDVISTKSQQGWESGELTSTSCYKPAECLQLIRANYITSTVCGQAALCNWELWNYRAYRELELNRDTYLNKLSYCDQFETQKLICYLHSRESQQKARKCKLKLRKCEQVLTRELYHDCQNLSAQAKSSGVTCEKSFYHHQFMINLLLKNLRNTIAHDNMTAVVGIAHLMPQLVRRKLDRERELQFEALNLNQDQIDWCSVGRNYACVNTEYDKLQVICDPKELYGLRVNCELWRE